MKSKKTLLCITETIIINVAVYFIFYYLQPDPAVYLQLNPHPLFILSIAMGMRYGNNLGLVSATISAIFYCYAFVALFGDISLLYSFFANYKHILSFYWSAVIFGLFKDNHDQVVERLRKTILESAQQYEKILKAYKNSQKVQQELKKQIIGSEESILNLYEIASRLESLEIEEVYTETIGILSKYLKADMVSIYTYDERSGYIRLKISNNEHSLTNTSFQIKDSEGYSKVINEQKVARWIDGKEENFPIMSAPLIKDHQVLAVINIDHMDFDKLSEYAYQLFKLIIDWVNKAIDRASLVDSLKNTKYFEGTRLLRPAAFEERLREEERRKKQFGMEYGLLHYIIKKPIALEELNQLISRLIRSVDVVGYETDLRRLRLLLPVTPGNKLYILENRILDRFGDGIEKIEE